LRRARKQGRQSFDYWRVEAIRKGNNFALLPAEQEVLKDAPADIGRDHQIVRSEKPLRAHGYVCITNQNIGRKHDERVFFTPEQRPGGSGTPWSAPVTVSVDENEWERLAKEWALLIRNYMAKNERPLKKRKESRRPPEAYLGSKIGETAFSRHLCDPHADKLKAGNLLYAKLDTGGRPVRLYPVMISRDLADVAPETLLPSALRPAATIEELSAADRVFGFVDQRTGRGGRGQRRAYKGQLRIASLRFAGTEDGGPAISHFAGAGLPLAILSTPKPEQARFYVAADTNGAPQRAGLSKAAAAYTAGKGLRGRKTYIHHADLPAGYWDGEAAKANPGERLGGRHREFVRQDLAQDDQNRSVGGWINVGARFRAEIDIVNLSKVELGALVFLLTLETGHHLRVGGGKPLGFGSIELTLEAVELADGIAIAGEACALIPLDRPGAGIRYSDIAQLASPDGPVAAYKRAAERAHAPRDDFEQIPFIRAFRNAARGFPAASVGETLALPVHYPRVSGAPSSEGKNYEWFVTNERTGRDAGPALPLDPLSDPTGLPGFGWS
jgi:CRISPR-associated protein (TIGR03986 family)